MQTFKYTSHYNISISTKYSIEGDITMGEQNNGAGKSLVLKSLCSELAQDGGRVARATAVGLGYLQRASLALEGAMERVNARVTEVDARVSTVDEKVGAVERKIAQKDEARGTEIGRMKQTAEGAESSAKKATQDVTALQEKVGAIERANQERDENTDANTRSWSALSDQVKDLLARVGEVTVDKVREMVASAVSEAVSAIRIPAPAQAGMDDGAVTARLEAFERRITEGAGRAIDLRAGEVEKLAKEAKAAADGAKTAAAEARAKAGHAVDAVAALEQAVGPAIVFADVCGPTLAPGARGVQVEEVLRSAEADFTKVVADWEPREVRDELGRIAEDRKSDVWDAADAVLNKDNSYPAHKFRDAVVTWLGGNLNADDAEVITSCEQVADAIGGSERFIAVLDAYIASGGEMKEIAEKIKARMVAIQG